MEKEHKINDGFYENYPKTPAQKTKRKLTIILSAYLIFCLSICALDYYIWSKVFYSLERMEKQLNEKHKPFKIIMKDGTEL